MSEVDEDTPCLLTKTHHVCAQTLGEARRQDRSTKTWSPKSPFIWCPKTSDKTKTEVYF